MTSRPPPPPLRRRVSTIPPSSFAPKIRYVDLADEAPTLKRPALDRAAARAVLDADKTLKLDKSPSTIPPLTIDATVERFAASPIAPDDDEDDLAPPTPRVARKPVRAAATIALLSALAFACAILGAAAARATAKDREVTTSWLGGTLEKAAQPTNPCH